ncbi:MAG: hypothetical protein ABI266_08345 [Ginsengibacter sp.]
MIKYIKQEEIDKEKWDKCLENSDNGLVYAYSFYLDAMSKKWDALVAGDYEQIMPLAWNRKYGISYLYQPPFCAQLGIFGNNISKEIVRSFLESVPKKFKYWDFYLNKSNLFLIEEYPIYERSNFVLPLNNSYENLSKNYAQSHLRNIKRAIKQENYVKKDIPLEDVIGLAKAQSQQFSNLSDLDYTNFLEAFTHLKNKNSACTLGVFSKRNQLMASCAFIFSHSRAYYILVGNHPDGRTSGASHLMIDYFIKEYSGKDLLLDFEGSSISSLAFFYKSFGATQENFAGIKVNRLSAIARLFRQ